MKKAKKIVWNIVFYLIIISVLGGAILFSINQDPEKSIMGYRFYEVLSGSMTPEFGVGDIVMVKLTDPKEIEIGDVVTMSVGTDETTHLTHRVIDKYQTEDGILMFQTQGDASPSADEPIESKSIIGVVTARLAVIGHIAGFVKANMAISIIGIVLLIVIIYCLKFLFTKEKVINTTNQD